MHAIIILAVDGTPKLAELKDGDLVLLLESCTHHVSCEDIGQVKAKRIKHVENDTFEVVLTEGKKRQIRMMFRALDEHVVYLQRISMARLELGKLAIGKWKYLSKEEIGWLGKKH